MDEEGLRQRIWIIKLVGRRKLHIARNDAAGLPRDTTLCGIPCAAADRQKSTKTMAPSGRECMGCLSRLSPKKRSELPGWIPCNGPDKKIHWLADDQRVAACGQKFAIWETGWIEMVTCDRCLALAARTGVRKQQNS